MTQAPSVVSIGFAGLSEFALEATRALRGHLTRTGGVLTQEAVASYFSGRSLKGDFEMPDVVASGSATYQRLVKTGLVSLPQTLDERSTELAVVDFGCGNGSLQSTLRQVGFEGQYIGYDFNEVLIAELARSNSPSQRFESTLTIKDADVVFLINVLVYTHDRDIQAVLGRAVELLKKGAHLVIVEPFPAWYWETKFDGLRLRLRDFEELKTMLARHNLTLSNSTVASIWTIARRPLFPLAWLGVWRNAS